MGMKDALYYEIKLFFAWTVLELHFFVPIFR